MDELLLRRDNDGETQRAGTGAVSLRIIYDSVLAIGKQGVVFMAEIFGKTDSRPIMKTNQVAAKVPKVVQDPHGELCAEAEKHAKAWMELDNASRCVCPVSDRHIGCIKGIARIVFHLLQFIFTADAINFLHKDVKMKNMFVVQSHSLELVRLEVGNFGAAKRGEDRARDAGWVELSPYSLSGSLLSAANIPDALLKQADGNIVYRPGDYTWNNTSSRMATTVYDARATSGDPRETVQLDRQLCLYNDLFGWARIAFTALADRPPPDIRFGPTASDFARIPELGYGDVLDAVHHLMCFALDLMTRDESKYSWMPCTSTPWNGTAPWPKFFLAKLMRTEYQQGF